MKNFDRQCLINGTSALQSECEHTLQDRGVIVEFPVHALDNAQTTSAHLALDKQMAPTQDRRFIFQGRMYARCGNAIRDLRSDGFGGCAFNRVKPWQAAIAGCTFSALAFASLFLGL